MATVWCFYTVQNDPGEDKAHPNAFRVKFDGPRPRAADIWDSFPLNGTGAFHLRFRLNSEGGYSWIDLLDGEDAVPMAGKRVIIQALRLDKLTCASRRVTALAPAEERSALRPRRRVPSTHREKARAVSVEEDADLMGGDAGGVGDQGGPTPTAEELDAIAEEDLDEDLHSSDNTLDTKRRIQWRRNRERRAAAAKVGEFRAAEEKKEAASKARFEVKQSLEPQLKEWGLAAGDSEYRPIRVLLSSLDKVLWSGHGWKTATMGELIDPKRVKVTYHKAVRVVHPDRQPPDADKERKFISDFTFHALNKAYKEFEEKELN